LPVAKTSPAPPAVPLAKPDGDRTPSATVISPVTATVKTVPVATSVEQPEATLPVAKTSPAPPAVPPVKPDGDRTPSATVIAPVTATVKTAPVAAPIEQPGSASPVAKMPAANPIILPVVRLDQAPMAITMPATETVSRLAATVAMATPVIDVTKKMIDGQQDRTPIRLDAPSATLSSALSASTAIGVTAAAVAESANVIQDEVAANRGAPQIMGGRPLQPLPADPFGAIEPTVTVQTDFAVKTLADEAQPASVPVTISPNFASPDQSTASTIHDSPLLVAAAAQARPQSAKELDAESPQLAKPSAESVVIRTTESTIPAASGSAITPPAGVTSAAPSRPEATTTPTFAQTTPGTVDFQQSNWERALSHQLNWMVNNRTQEAQIRVNPPDLGPIEVRMSLQQNQTNVAFVCHESAVREAIENALPRLREMLNGQGILLNQAQVSDQSLARQQSGFGEQPYSRRESGSETATPDRNPVTDADEQPLRHRRSLGMVDHYV
ncbi:MAG: flagellar hook-length control protein FliK, partial [Candidatus Contendobacter sp.]|nr:flagellar hook-length control protein FliK [Candidatus Contendobacter sp.]